MKLARDQKMVLFFVFLLMIIFYLFIKYSESQIEINRKTTVCIVNDYYNGSEQGPGLGYKFYINKIKYSGGASLKNKEYSDYKNNFFVVEYY